MKSIHMHFFQITIPINYYLNIKLNFLLFIQFRSVTFIVPIMNIE